MTLSSWSRGRPSRRLPRIHVCIDPGRAVSLQLRPEVEHRAHDTGRHAIAITSEGEPDWTVMERYIKALPYSSSIGLVT